MVTTTVAQGAPPCRGKIGTHNAAASIALPAGGRGWDAVAKMNVPNTGDGHRRLVEEDQGGVGTLAGDCRRVTPPVCTGHHDCARREAIRRIVRSASTSSTRTSLRVLALE